jgi:hypothetical protein
MSLIIGWVDGIYDSLVGATAEALFALTQLTTTENVV